LRPLSPKTDGIKNFLDMFYPITRSDVPVRIMTISFHTSYNIDAVRPLFKGMEDMKDIYLTGAWNDNGFNIRRVL